MQRCVSELILTGAIDDRRIVAALASCHTAPHRAACERYGTCHNLQFWKLFSAGAVHGSPAEYTSLLKAHAAGLCPDWLIFVEPEIERALGSLEERSSPAEQKTRDTSCRAENNLLHGPLRVRPLSFPFGGTEWTPVPVIFGRVAVAFLELVADTAQKPVPWNLANYRAWNTEAGYSAAAKASEARCLCPQGIQMPHASVQHATYFRGVAAEVRFGPAEHALACARWPERVGALTRLLYEKAGVRPGDEARTVEYLVATGHHETAERFLMHFFPDYIPLNSLDEGFVRGLGGVPPTPYTLRALPHVVERHLPGILAGGIRARDVGYVDRLLGRFGHVMDMRTRNVTGLHLFHNFLLRTARISDFARKACEFEPLQLLALAIGELMERRALSVDYGRVKLKEALHYVSTLTDWFDSAQMLRDFVALCRGLEPRFRAEFTPSRYVSVGDRRRIAARLGREPARAADYEGLRVKQLRWSPAEVYAELAGLVRAGEIRFWYVEDVTLLPLYARDPAAFGAAKNLVRECLAAGASPNPSRGRLPETPSDCVFSFARAFEEERRRAPKPRLHFDQVGVLALMAEDAASALPAAAEGTRASGKDPAADPHETKKRWHAWWTDKCSPPSDT